MRKPPQAQLKDVPDKAPSKDGYVTRERKYELITPLFGGGVAAGVNDPITLINGKSVRGQLRFWWRAIRGGFGNSEEGLAEMKRKETELWGAASTPEFPAASKVQIVVSVISTETEHRREWPFSDERANPGWKDLAYVAFPLQQKGNSVTSDIAFKLTLSYPEVEKIEIEAALWAWETFGGIGGRTRRGFGAIRQSTITYPSKLNKVEDGIKNNLAKYIGEREEWHDKVPHLSKNLSFVIVTGEDNKKRTPFKDANQAWEELVKALKGFRQRRGQTGFGRNKWPEPEQIRRLTKQRLTKHGEDAVMLGIQKFPRAAFGLPIIFHFKDNDKTPPDPADTTLKGGLISNSKGQPKYRERLASRLILRPIACGGSQAVGLAVLLEGPVLPPEGLMLVGNGLNEVVDATVNKIEAKQIEALKQAAAKLKNDDELVDVVGAFLVGLREKEEEKEK